MIKKIILFVILSSILALNVFAAGELIIELGKPELLPRTGFEQEVFLPYAIKNIGDQPVTSRFPVKSFSSDETYPHGPGMPLYIYTGEMQGPEYTPNPAGVPIKKADGTTYFQKSVNQGVLQLPDGLVIAPTVTLQPGESLVFDQQHFMNSFYVSKSGKYTFGYEVEPSNELDGTKYNELPNVILTNAKASITMQVGNPNFVKGPNTEFKLAANQYWFYFQDLGECVNIDLPQNKGDIPQKTDVCLLTDTPFAFKMSIGGTEVTLYHFFDWWSTTKNVNGISITASEDGFVLTY